MQTYWRIDKSTVNTCLPFATIFYLFIYLFFNAGLFGSCGYDDISLNGLACKHCPSQHKTAYLLSWLVPEMSCSNFYFSSYCSLIALVVWSLESHLLYIIIGALLVFQSSTSLIQRCLNHFGNLTRIHRSGVWGSVFLTRS